MERISARGVHSHFVVIQRTLSTRVIFVFNQIVINAPGDRPQTYLFEFFNLNCKKIEKKRFKCNILANWKL